ncbi:MAG: DegV family protein [Acutalibacteraceae bacterium]|nr:DegV family protein [Acutalibacteraceae bacterium]
MNKNIIISTDSCSDLPKEIIERYNIKTIAMPISMGGKAYHDGIDIFPSDIFSFYDEKKELPRTSTPNVNDNIEHFKKLVDGGKNEVIHFTISSDMSGSYNYARMAAEEFEGVYCIDSKNLSTGIALLICKACELAQSGMAAKDIVDEINATVEKVDASFVIDTLEFLHKGGRCSSVAMFGANLLKLKPCIEVKNGSMDVAEKFRGKMSAVLKEYVDKRLADADDIDLTRCFVTHTYIDDKTIPNEIKAYVSEKLPFKEVIENTAGSTISTHCGPGTLGVLFIRKTPLK